MPRHAGRAPEVTRERILDAAAEVLADHGFDAARVDEIARRSGSSKGAIYFHFPSKEDLILRMVERMSDRLIGKVRSTIEHEPPSRARLRLAVAVLLDTFARKRTLGHLLLVNLVGHGKTLDRKFLPVRQRFRSFIREELDGAVDAGELPADVDTEIASRVWLGALHEVILHWLLDDHPKPLADTVPVLQDLLLGSVTAAGGEGGVATARVRGSAVRRQGKES